MVLQEVGIEGPEVRMYFPAKALAIMLNLQEKTIYLKLTKWAKNEKRRLRVFWRLESSTSYRKTIPVFHLEDFLECASRDGMKIKPSYIKQALGQRVGHGPVDSSPDPMDWSAAKYDEWKLKRPKELTKLIRSWH